MERGIIYYMKKKNLKIVTPKNIILLIVTCILIHILYISPMMSDDFEFASYHFNNIGKIMRILGHVY